MTTITGGTEAPQPRRKKSSKRRQEITKRAAQGLAANQKATGTTVATGGIGRASQANLGQQLSRRVASGAISQEQADRTAQERALLKQAYGSSWRAKVFGQNVQALRTGLAGDKAGDPQYKAAYALSLERRKKMLEEARRKLAGK